MSEDNARAKSIMVVSVSPLLSVENNSLIFCEVASWRFVLERSATCGGSW